MAMKLINESSLVAIGNAIRAKNGSSDTYTPAEMVTAIGNISGGGEPVEVLPSNLTTFNNVRGDYLFTGQTGKILLNNYLDQLSFTDMQSMPYAFAEMGNYGDSVYPNQGILPYPTDLSSLHIYFKDNSNNTQSYGGYIDLSYMFTQANYIQNLPKFHFTNTGAYNCSYMFYNSKSILNVDDFMNSLIFLNTSQSKSQCMFQSSSLKNIPHLEKLMYGGQITGSYSNDTIYSQGFSNCYELQELLNLPVFNPTDSTKNNTGNIFYNSFNNCSTLSRLVFNTDNGNPIVARWSKQSINLGNKMYIGYFQRIGNVLDSNIPVVTDQTTYEQYKNGVYHTALVEYSRYNHDSAVETINSLPDTSAVSNGTNKILFLGASGSATDGGAISNLTEAEIQVATDKGWTVSIT